MMMMVVVVVVVVLTMRACSGSRWTGQTTDALGPVGAAPVGPVSIGG
jgi:hypothetical protein